MTSLVGLIGDPVAHSVSPVFQQAALDVLGLDGRYEAWLTTAAELPARIASLRATGVLGANVTVPHKQAVVPLLDEVEVTVRRTGAVNTILHRDGRLTGYNTDVQGFVDALRLDGGFDPAGARVAVVGAGGAARAVVWGLLDAGAGMVTIVNRTPARAAALAKDLDDPRAGYWPGSPEADTTTAILEACDLIVNCTSVGMLHSAQEQESPIPAGAISPGTFVADIVANPLVTPLLRVAAERGCRNLGGLPMLVRQGAAAFELWTGQPAPLEIMRAAARQAMGLDA
jgi:shikimate dehydrogenase